MPYDHTVIPDLAFSNLPTPPLPTGPARDRILAVLTHHRRARNCRACTGCSWRAVGHGPTGDPAATRARHADFNAHLAELITAVAAQDSEGEA